MVGASERESRSMNLTPKQAAEKLGISVASLRRWSGEFAAALSSYATPPAGQRRSYTPDNLTVLQHARELLAAGNSVSEVAAILPTIEIDSEPPDSETLPAPANQFEFLDRLIEQVSTLADQRSQIDRQAGEIDDLCRRLDALETDKRKPWYRRLLGGL